MPCRRQAAAGSLVSVRNFVSAWNVAWLAYGIAKAWQCLRILTITHWPTSCLTRADLYDALAQRIWDDPTTMLECRRTARRDEARQVPALAAPKSPPQMLGVRGLSPPPTDRPARYFV
jgi:hypothetical protein